MGKQRFTLLGSWKHNIDLVEGQAEYIFYRDTSDGASATTVAGTNKVFMVYQI